MINKRTGHIWLLLIIAIGICWTVHILGWFPWQLKAMTTRGAL